MLKPGGKLVLSCPPAMAELPLRIYERFLPNHGEGPHRFPSTREVKGLLCAAGLELQRHESTLFVPVGPRWLRRLDSLVERTLARTPLGEFGIRQFFVCRRPHVVALCLLPLASTAIGELRNPPSAPPGRGDGPPGFGPPGFGPGFGPGQFLGPAFLKEADADKSGAVSPAEFKALAARWFDAWDADRDGSLKIEELSLGLRSVLVPQSGMGGPMPMPAGPPGFGPEMFLAPAVYSACDENRDGKLTREEMTGAFTRWFREWDEGSKGSLDAAALGRGLERLLGPPPVF